MKTIEIYNYDKKKTEFIIQTRKSKNIQNDVIKYLEDQNYDLIIQGKIVPGSEMNIYWLACNKNTKKIVKLWYKEKKISKKSMLRMIPCQYEKNYKYENKKNWKIIVKKLRSLWRNFWGSKYRIYEDGVLTNELLIYHRKIYLKKLR